MKKRKIDVVVISDVHLGSPSSKAEELLIYLSSIKPKTLVLNGDFIDPFYIRRNSFPKTHLKVIKKILSLLSEGSEVYYITSNNDNLFRKFTGSMFSRLHFQDKLITDMDGKSVCILHGSIFDTSPALSKWLIKLGALGMNILSLKHKLRQHRQSKKGKIKEYSDAHSRIQSQRDLTSLSKFDRSALEMAFQNQYDTLICGYSHQPRKTYYESNKGRWLYLNSGDWVEHLTALEYSFKRWKLYSFKHDKLTAFYGDEELRDMDVADLLEKRGDLTETEKFSRTAS
ncbi:UDP-2,3-diacylglucosamine diphosphatase [Muriicola marianensis]|uniref:UDP-2,3-diacylglucosamine hydrolase n=1 Tax=Muriicola marianensis TaxID=1324801 RepID=A0ABQ1QS47_9FLAO|nr:UDP-2,3-diacylglucosamine diphosphatase [Muriicola marianensis]GGD39482.1 UDP-2,3-diacylglucosamine hydrolase [Muriicola marianensis]